MALDDQIRQLLKTARTIGAAGLPEKFWAWLQWAVIQREAARRAHEAGLNLVVDRCVQVEHQRRRESEERRA